MREGVKRSGRAGAGRGSWGGWADGAEVESEPGVQASRGRPLFFLVREGVAREQRQGSGSPGEAAGPGAGGTG